MVRNVNLGVTVVTVSQSVIKLKTKQNDVSSRLGETFSNAFNVLKSSEQNFFDIRFNNEDVSRSKKLGSKRESSLSETV